MGDVSKTKRAFRLLIYLSGLVILAVGITLKTKTTLGVSPIISVAYSVSQIWGLNFANVTFFWYGVFIVAVLGVGRVVAVFERLFGAKIRALIS